MNTDGAKPNWEQTQFWPFRSLWLEPEVNCNCLRILAAERGIPLYKYIAELSGNRTDRFITPVPSLNVINGGKHAGNKLAMQEFMLLPTGANSFREVFLNLVKERLCKLVLRSTMHLKVLLKRNTAWMLQMLEMKEDLPLAFKITLKDLNF